MTAAAYASTKPARRRGLSYDDLLKFPDDGKRRAIGGVLFVTSPSTRHQRIVGNLYFFLRRHLETQGGGEAFLSPFDVVLTPRDVVEPDLLYISAQRRARLTEAHLQGSPDLAIEVLSPKTRKRDDTIKRRRYERKGVAEYWLVDPDHETVKAYRADETGKSGSAFELRREDDDRLESPLFPGLQLPLSAVCAS